MVHTKGGRVSALPLFYGIRKKSRFYSGKTWKKSRFCVLKIKKKSRFLLLE